MAKDKERRIGDIINEADILPPVTALKNYLNKEFIIDSIEKKAGTIPDEEGTMRPWYMIEARDPETNESILLSCGATTVVKQLDALVATEHLPLKAMCVQHNTGRMIKLV